MSLDAQLQRELGRDVVSTLEHRDLEHAVPLVAPRDEAMLALVLRLATRERWKILPLGAGSKLSWSRPPHHVDLALTTRRLTGITAYEPGDGTISARAGTTLEELRTTARSQGHHLTPDVPRPGSATLGGVLASAQSGLDRTRSGPIRNHVLGMRVAMADGRIAKTGGRLVKNVTGYDLHRLYCGSQGTLCVILEASLRLFAGPAVELAMECGMQDVGSAMAKLRPLARLGIKPYCVRLESALTARGAHDEHDAHPWMLHILLGGRAETVEWERTAILDVLPEARVIAAPDTEARFTGLRDAERWDGELPLLSFASVPSLLPTTVSRVESWAREHGLVPAFLVEPTTGVAHVRLEQSDDRVHARSPLTARDFADGVRALAHDGVDLRVLGGSRDVRLAIDSLNVTPPALRLMQKLKAALDPDSVLSSGRMHPDL